MKNLSPNRITRLLVSLAFIFSLSCLFTVAQTTSKSSRGLRSLTPGRTLTMLEGPISSDPFWCEWQRGSNKATGMLTMTPEFTRAMPKNGWLATLHNKFSWGDTLEQKVQLYNPQPAYSKPRNSSTPPRLIGTDWDFQTIDGKVRCKVFVSTSKGEVRFSNCTNGNSQYCVTQGVFDGLIKKSCTNCSSGNSAEQAGCLARCLDDRLGGSGASQSDFCKKYPVGCLSWMTQRFIKRYPSDPGQGEVDLFTGEMLAAASVDKQKFILEVLRAMYKAWINFVNGELGPCVTSHFCPAGTNCGINGQCQLMFGTP